MIKPGENIHWRNTGQDLLPVTKQMRGDKYDIYPSFEIGENLIFKGYESLIKTICTSKFVIIDGYSGVFFEQIKEHIDYILHNNGYSTAWIDILDFLKPAETLRQISSVFIGEEDDLFGKRCTLNLEDFFNLETIKSINPQRDIDINFCFGPGAFFIGWDGLKIYFDVPKNEILFRSRAGSITNFGEYLPKNPKEMYRQFYFIDWVILNKHKKNILSFIDIYVDSQRPENPVWIQSENLKKALSQMSHNVFRPRPWFEPGPWGGTWIKENIEGLNNNVPNYAWSYELITPENGLLIESSGLLLEVSFDSLMYLEAPSVLGECYSRFGTEFPIRFDFLDTFNGGNLSIQCHPGPDYIKEHFGENFTQEESYYILDTKDNAEVFLGFQEDIDPAEFRKALEESADKNKVIDPGKYVLSHKVNKHDLLLIPYGTIHGSGKNNLVLEISTTPYIFTFKMYDWLRMDLTGMPRTLNISRGMENLYFDRKGDYINQRLMSKPELLEKGDNWKLFHLPTHETHLYDVHRYHFKNMIEIHTNGKCLVMSLVEGKTIDVETFNGYRKKFSYAETFIIPSAAKSVRIINNSQSEAILIKAFVK